MSFKNLRPSLAREQPCCWSTRWQSALRQLSATERGFLGSGPASDQPTARTGIRSRQISTGSKLQSAIRASAVASFADLEVPRAFLSGSALLSEFLEYGVCREQYFTEVSLKSDLAAEARSFAEALAQQSSSTAPDRPVQTQDHNEVLTVETSAKALEGESLPLEFKQSASPQTSRQQHQRKQRARRVKFDHQSAKQKPAVGSSLKSRREARRSSWQQYAVTGAALGLEAGAVEYAARRRMQQERQRAQASAKVSRRHSAEAENELQQLRPHTDSGAELDSALDLLLGRQGDVLGRQEELRLIQDMQDGLAIHRAIDDLKAQHVRLPTAEELTERLGMTLQSVSDTLTRGLRAKHVLLHANKRLVFKLAHSFGFDRRVPYEEYVLSLTDASIKQQYQQQAFRQWHFWAGMEGLVKGLLKFDPRRGHKLSSLLVWWIRASISSLATALNSIVHIPKQVQYALHSMSRARRRLIDELGRRPTTAELCQALNLPAKDVDRLLAAESRSTVQLEDVVSATSGSSQMAKAWGGGETGVDLSHEDLLHAAFEDTPEGMLRRVSLEDFLDKQMSALSQRDAEIVRALYGLRNAPSGIRLQKQVAVEFGVTPKRISQIKLQVLQALRHSHAEILQQAVTVAAQ